MEMLASSDDRSSILWSIYSYYKMFLWKSRNIKGGKTWTMGLLLGERDNTRKPLINVEKI
jgi:hypothetical protein